MLHYRSSISLRKGPIHPIISYETEDGGVAAGILSALVVESLTSKNEHRAEL